jgi:hypothetical protein
MEGSSDEKYFGTLVVWVFYLNPFVTSQNAHIWAFFFANFFNTFEPLADHLDTRDKG